MADSVTVFVPGKVYWAKIIGEPRNNYENTGKEWAYELVPDDVTFLKDNKLLDRLKDKEDPKNPEKGEYLNLRKPAKDKEGNDTAPIRIYDSENNDWDGTLLGNGTRVVAKLNIKHWGKGKKSSIYTQALRVEELVPYSSDEFAGYSGGSGASQTDAGASVSKVKPKTKVQDDLDDLDDDLPF